MEKLKLTLILFMLFCPLFAQWELKTTGLPAEWTVSDQLSVAEDSTVVGFFSTIQFPGQISISHDLADTWTNHTTPEQWPGEDVWVIDRNRIWFCTADGKIYHSGDGGINWILQYEDTLNDTFFNFIKFFDEQNGIAVGDANSNTLPAPVLKTTDGGNNWINVNDSSLIGEISWDIFFYIEFPSINIGYFAGSKAGRNYNELYKTTNGGKSWQEITRPAGVKRVCIIKFYDENLGLLVEDVPSQEDYVYRTTDGGGTWTKSSFATKPGLHDIEFIPGNPSNVWMTDFEKLYFSSDTGSTWQEVFVTSQSLDARNIEFLNDSIGFISCDNGYFWATFNKGGIVTSVKNETKTIPADFILFQNYPNPFNPTTKIKYTIPGSADVRIDVFNTLGEKVSTLVNQMQQPGNYEVSFDATNLSSGVYFYELQAGSFKQSAKMLLAK